MEFQSNFKVILLPKVVFQFQCWFSIQPLKYPHLVLVYIGFVTA